MKQELPASELLEFDLHPPQAEQVRTFLRFLRML